MQIVNLPTVSVDNVGVVILTSAQATAAASSGMNTAIINPSVDIVLVDPSSGSNWANIPGSTAGSVANSPFVCPANTATVVAHRSGQLKAISTSGTATVKIGLGCTP